jgi:two-component system sensor histidine kinase TctE
MVVLGTSGTVLVAAAWIYARVAADQAYDRVLLTGALQIAENTWLQNGTLDVDVPVSAFYVLSKGDRVFYKVLDPHGRVAAGDADLHVDIPERKLRQGPVLLSARYHGLPVRVAMVGREMFDSQSRGWATIVLAQTEDSRSELAASLTLKVLMVIVTMGVITLAGAMLAVRQALIPMKQLESAIRLRDPNSAAPLDVNAPIEAAALVNTLNQFIQRLDARMTMMRRVVGDVAHQLRTPITAAASQVELLDLEQTDAGRRRQIGKVRDRLSEVGALVQQLVSHAMALHRAETRPFESVELVALVRREMTTLLSDESHSTIEAVFEGSPETIFVRGDPVTLREAVRNVLNNAMLYGARSRLTVAVARLSMAASVQVLDDGPGIPPEDWLHVRQAFNRRRGERGGASLGLSIVEQILKTHGGSMTFAFAESGEFSVTLNIPIMGVPLISVQ